MNDDGFGQSRRPGQGSGAPGPGGPGAPGPIEDVPDDALESLERLQALSGGPQRARQAPPQRGRGPGPQRRSKLPSVSRQGLSWARFAAPIAFLAAVLIVFSLAVQSGVVRGGDDEPAQPAPTVTSKTKPSASSSAAATYKTYVVKAGDSLTGIADKYDTTVTDLEDLNPKADLTTLQVGQKIRVPL